MSRSNQLRLVPPKSPQDPVVTAAWDSMKSSAVDDAALHAPDAGMKGLDPIVIIDAILGTPDNLERLAEAIRILDEEVPDETARSDSPHRCSSVSV